MNKKIARAVFFIGVVTVPTVGMSESFADSTYYIAPSTYYSQVPLTNVNYGAGGLQMVANIIAAGSTSGAASFYYYSAKAAIGWSSPALDPGIGGYPLY